MKTTSKRRRDGTSRYVKTEDAARLDQLAGEAGVSTSTLITTLTWNFGEKARDLAAENRVAQEELAARIRGPRQEGRAA